MCRLSTVTVQSSLFFASDMIEEVLEGRAGLPPVNANGVNTEPCSTPTSHLRLTSTNMEDSVPPPVCAQSESEAGIKMVCRCFIIELLKHWLPRDGQNNDTFSAGEQEILSFFYIHNPSFVVGLWHRHYPQCNSAVHSRVFRFRCVMIVM